MVRRKADIENDGNHITDAEVTSYINTAIEQLFSILVADTDGSLFAKNASAPTALGDNAYQLPSDFGNLVSVQVKKSGQYIRSVQADPEDYASLALLEDNGILTPYAHYLKWNIDQGRGEVFIFPAPSSTSDIAVRYVPTPPVLSLSTDELKLPPLWYQWVVLDAAVYCMLKEESDPSGLMAQRGAVEKQIRTSIRALKVTEFSTIRRARWGRRY